MGGGASKVPQSGPEHHRKQLKAQDSIFVNKEHIKKMHHGDDVANEPKDARTPEHPRPAPIEYAVEPLSPAPNSGPYTPKSTRRGSLTSSWEPDQASAHARLVRAASDGSPKIVAPTTHIDDIGALDSSSNERSPPTAPTPAGDAIHL